jgi:hypothetical protein
MVTTSNLCRLASVEAFVQQLPPSPTTSATTTLVGGSDNGHFYYYLSSSPTRSSHRCPPIRLPRLFSSPESTNGAEAAADMDGDATKKKKQQSKSTTTADDTTTSSSAATTTTTATAAPAVGAIYASDPYSFVVPILGDLHIDPRKMEDYTVGREHIVRIIDEAKQTLLLKDDNSASFNGEDGSTSSTVMDRVALVSLGDLGESKNCDHNPDNPFELFAGTTKCHTMAAEFLNNFEVPYEVIGGNHDLEGIDEFDTDAKNLRRFLKAHNKTTPQFCRQVAEKTLLVGLGSTVFREAKYTSHEVIIDDDQIHWFEELVKSKPSEEGWRIFVFSHAPPNGSGIRIIQENHVVNGCCWLNHSDEKKCRKFIEIVRENRCIKVSARAGD